MTTARSLHSGRAVVRRVLDLARNSFSFIPHQTYKGQEFQCANRTENASNARSIHLRNLRVLDTTFLQLRQCHDHRWYCDHSRQESTKQRRPDLDIAPDSNIIAFPTPPQPEPAEPELPFARAS